jgi:hypothetical protein
LERDLSQNLTKRKGRSNQKKILRSSLDRFDDKQYTMTCFVQ